MAKWIRLLSKQFTQLCSTPLPSRLPCAAWSGDEAYCSGASAPSCCERYAAGDSPVQLLKARENVLAST